MPIHLRHHPFLLSAILTALCVALGYALLWLPNVELITAGIFISGLLTGPMYGVWIGVAAAFLFSTLNPYGTAALPLLLAQMVVMGMVGWSGAIMTKWLPQPGVSGQTALRFGAAGLILTGLYDVLTNLSIAMMMSMGEWQKMLPIIMAGMAFAVIHLISNTLIFALVVPTVSWRLRKMMSPPPPGDRP